MWMIFDSAVLISQFNLSVPYQLRFLFAYQPKVMSQVLGIVYRAITTYITQQAGYTKVSSNTGAVTFIQRFGGAVNLNVHFHSTLVLIGFLLTIYTLNVIVLLDSIDCGGSASIGLVAAVSLIGALPFFQTGTSAIRSALANWISTNALSNGLG